MHRYSPDQDLNVVCSLSVPRLQRSTAERLYSVEMKGIQAKFEAALEQVTRSAELTRDGCFRAVGCDRQMPRDRRVDVQSMTLYSAVPGTAL